MRLSLSGLKKEQWNVLEAAADVLAGRFGEQGQLVSEHIHTAAPFCLLLLPLLSQINQQSFSQVFLNAAQFVLFLLGSTSSYLCP